MVYLNENSMRNPLSVSIDTHTIINTTPTFNEDDATRNRFFKYVFKKVA